MYYKKTWEAGASVAVHEGHAPSIRRITPKQAALAKSRAAVKAYNDKISKRDLAIKINENFLPGDGNVTLVYRRDERPMPEMAVQHWRKFRKDVRAAAKAAGVPFRWVHSIGVGVKGAIHHHLIVNKECLPLLAQHWPYGGVHVEFLYDKRNYQKLAKYFCGQEKGENPDDPKAVHVFGNKYSTSRNLRRVEPTHEIATGDDWEKYPDASEGRVVDIDSIDLGKNPVSGAPWRFYITLPLQAPKSYTYRQRQEWLEREAAKNKAEVRWKVDKLLQALAEKERTCPLNYLGGDFE